MAVLNHICGQKSARDEADVLRAVERVHAMIDQEISAGTRPEDVFIFGLSQGGTTCSSLLCSTPTSSRTL
uniref:Phospholipase/carboxylesterase/thioesterase domain-containing protein n=1 Tax=Aegilops tauschii subsp. strangulata TaxID=200361 RepID=A0A453DCP4_AEGTS